MPPTVPKRDLVYGIATDVTQHLTHQEVLTYFAVRTNTVRHVMTRNDNQYLP